MLRTHRPDALVAQSERRASIAITGPMLGRNPGYVTTQGEFLTDLLREAGHDVVSKSVLPGRLARLLDIAETLIRRSALVDIVVLETYSGPSFVIEDISSAITRSNRTPMIFHLHGGAMPVFARRFPRWTRRVLGRAAAIVAPSAFLARELAAYAPHIRVIPNILELDDYEFRLRGHVAPKLFWMRAYHRIYNPLMAIRVLARIRETLPDATLVMAGQEKGMFDEVAAAAREHGLIGSVELLGFLAEREKREIAARCDVFINTTHVDNAPVGVVEMCAMGLPVVSTDVGGIPDLLEHERTALLVGDDDVNGMAQAILRLVREPSLAARLSGNGVAVAAKCAWPAVRSQWEALFAEVLASPTNAR